jgi:glycosyltransferase involved in cell wall biosynthesis
MAMGIPTVATPEAAKGVQCVSGRDLLVAAGPTAFANEIMKIIENATLRKRLAEAGRLRIEQVHTWEGSVKVLDTVLNEMPKCIETLTANPGTGLNREPYLSVR